MDNLRNLGLLYMVQIQWKTVLLGMHLVSVRGPGSQFTIISILLGTGDMMIWPPDSMVFDAQLCPQMQEQQDADLAVALAEAMSLLYDPHLLEVGNHHFVQVRV